MKNAGTMALYATSYFILSILAVYLDAIVGLGLTPSANIAVMIVSAFVVVRHLPSLPTTLTKVTNGVSAGLTALAYLAFLPFISDILWDNSFERPEIWVMVAAFFINTAIFMIVWQSFIKRVTPQTRNSTGHANKSQS